MYKKLSLFAVILLAAFVAFAQPSQYTPMTAQGYQFKRILCDSTLHLPSFCGVPNLRNSSAKNGALAMDTCNNKLYQWTNANGWSDITTGGIDTTSLSNRIDARVKYTDTATMLLPYLRKVDTTAMLSKYLRKVDTTAMLQPYLRKVDTASLSNRINLKVNISDTGSMLTPYLRKIDTTAMLSKYLRKVDTTAMLLPYLRKIDTTAILLPYLRKVDTTAMMLPYLRKIDTTSMLLPYLRKIDTTAMLSKYLRKIDTTAMLLPYLRKVDTTNKWVTNVVSVNDTTFRIFKGTTSTDITIHAGGGSGSTPDLQAVTTAGATTDQMVSMNWFGLFSTDYNKVIIPSLANYYPFYSSYPTTGAVSYIQMTESASSVAGNDYEYYNGISSGDHVKINPDVIEMSGSNYGQNVQIVPTYNTFGDIHYLPISDNATDTLATLADVRNGATGFDTTNLWVTSVTQPNDSTIRVVKGASSNDYVIRAAVAGSATRLVTTVYNNSGATITKGSVVYINGRHSSNLPTIALAQANTEANSYSTFALVENDIANANSGIVIQAGNITNLNLPTSSYTDGQLVYLSPTVAGGITTTKPFASDHIVKLGTVTRAHPTFGTIELKIENGWQMDELSDVKIAAVPNDSTLLQFSRVDSLWHDVSPANAIGLKNGGTKTYSSTITWTGTAPTGTTNHSYSWTQIGKMVTISVRLIYGTAGTGNTGVQMAIPADCPTPSGLAGLTAANDYLYPGTAYLHTATTTPSAFCRGGIRNNPANNGLEMYAIIAASTAVRTVWLTVTYWTN